MPSKDYMDAHCSDGLRLELAFPSCGTGKLDSDDHKSHMAYPSLVKEGICPDGYDHHYPFMFYETIWATNAFAGESGQFLLSFGDPVGTGYHGDFIMGWESEEFLQSALDQCGAQVMSGNIQECPLFDIQDDSEAAKCTFIVPEELKHDQCEGPRDGLPVDVPIQYGPEEATTYAVAGRSGQATTTVKQTQAPTTFSERPTLSYSPADPASTSTAQGGIIVAAYNSGADIKNAAAVAPSSTVTPVPSPQPATPQGSIVSTTYVTDGDVVTQLFIEEVDVTVTATATETAAVRRHLQHHRHHHRRS